MPSQRLIPMHAILRIDEVEKQGASRITDAAANGGNVATFPVPLFRPKSEPES